MSVDVLRVRASRRAGAPSAQAARDVLTVPAALEALVRVRLVGGAEHEAFEKHLRTDPAVVEAWRLASDCDYEVRLSCRTLADLDGAVNELRAVGGHTSTTLVLHRVNLDER
ncbi:MAG: Lrp/AsnC ligand binding domain-containing protein [Actinoallomurus sp.]